MAGDQNDEEAQGLTNESRKAIILEIAPFLRSNQRDKALAACKQFRDDEDRVAIIGALAPRLTRNQRAEALEIIKSLLRSDYRASALIDLAPYLTAAEHRKVRAILESNQKVSDSTDRLFNDAQVIAHLARYAKGNERNYSIPIISLREFQITAAGPLASKISRHTFFPKHRSELVREAVESAKKIP